MKILLLLPIIFFWIQEMLAQASPVFQFEPDKIIISQEKLLSDFSLKVFKGKVSETEIFPKRSIIGKIENSKNIVTFSPLVPFNWDQNYTLVYNNEITHFQIPLPIDYQQLAIQSIFPSKKMVPANILKWYVQFSQPINPANIYDHIHFLDADGNKIPRAILPLENVLLDEHGKLLTLWIEPGRQKRGLGPNEKLGSVFEIGQTYSLIISKKLKDKKGINMHQDWEHHFSIADNDRISPKPKTWEIKPPSSNTTSALEINFKEPIDYGSTLHTFKIHNSLGVEIIGEWKWTDSETILLFTPKQNWRSDNYQILVPTSMEDLAGNNLNRLFDGAVQRKNEVSKDEVFLDFIIKKLFKNEAQWLRLNH